MLRRMTPSSAQLTGGDLSVDILHTEDSVQIGDGTNLLGSFPLVGALRSLPVANAEFATNATLTGGTTKVQIYDPGSTDGGVAEVDLVGTERALKVSVISSVGGGGGGTAATDSSAFTATATQGTPIMGAFDDVTPDALAEGEMGIARMTSDRALHTYLTNSSIAVTGTFYQATQPVSAASLPLPSGASTSANQTTIIGHLDGVEGLLTTIDADTGNISTKIDTLAAAVTLSKVQTEVTNTPTVTVGNASLAVTGTFWQATQPVSGTFWQATQPVSIASMPATPVTDNGGSLTVDGTVTVGNASLAVTGTFWQATQPVSIAAAVTTTPGGNVAHDGVDSGNPVKIGGKGVSSFPAAAAHLDRVDALFDIRGRQITQPHGPRENFALTSTTITSSTAETTIAAAAGAGIFKELVSLSVTNSSSTGTIVTLKDATAGTTRGIWYVPATSGFIWTPSAPAPQGTANNNWTLTCGTSVASIYVVAQTVNVV